MVKRLFAILIMFLVVCNTFAQEATKSVASMFAIGSINQLDTYLSPEKYYGTNFRFISEVTRDSNKQPLIFMLTHDGAISTTHNRVQNAKQLSGHYDFAYSIMRRWELPDNRWTFAIGGMANTNIGFCYNMRNSSNNPAQGYASLDIGLQGKVSYNFELFNKQIQVNYVARLPLIGCSFSPNYGQSYYEIFQNGDYDHNIVFRSIATPQLRQQLTFDMKVAKRTSVRIGYLGDYRQAKPNNIKQHNYTHAAIIGVVINK